ncbi:D-alanyl-D-alanine carboxypeptidase family protein [Bdellovibrio sp. HCB2-146]|uniref:M15 family metallopeptidase n=1 Tax=Bdellovibrio sp. HCB2-146 TaxID=3394362 RepID=UPI0039BC480A
MLISLTLVSFASSAWADSADCVVEDIRLNRSVDGNHAHDLSPVGKNIGLPASYQPDPAAEPIPYEYITPVFREALVQNNEYIYMAPESLKALLSLIDDAKRDGIELFIHSAFRPFKTQCSVFKQKLNKEMQAGAVNIQDAIRRVNTRSALPGESEHQLGTAADLVTDIPGIGYQLVYDMQNTDSYRWLRMNAYKFGFVLSYPRGTAQQPGDPDPRTGYIFEPWHWRYIGVRNANKFVRCRNVSLQDFLTQLQSNPNFECR